jgi:hypothetical protein
MGGGAPVDSGGQAGAAAGADAGDDGSPLGGQTGTGGGSAGMTGMTGGAPGTAGATPGTGGDATATGGTPAGTGGASNGGAPGSGGRAAGGGGGGPGGAAGFHALSIDFVGGRLPPTSNGGAGGTAGSGVAGGSGLIALPAMAATEIAGFKPAACWNEATDYAGSLPGLTLSDGSVSTAMVTWTSPPSDLLRGVWWLGYTDAPGNVRMMNGYLDPHTSAATILVQGLPPEIATAAGYDVYVYGAGDLPSGTRTYKYTIGTTTFTVSQTGPQATTFPGFMLAPAGGSGNYVVFRKVIGSTFTLLATPDTGSAPRAPVNGLQIVWPSGS